MRLRTIAVRLPPSPMAALVPASSRRLALATSCTVREGVPMGRTATMTGTVNGRPGRTAAGGVASNVKLNSRGAAIVDEV